ncbi:HvfC family RiPP maturation protein [Pseudomonas plecoglossicida]|uniref:HvfC family RiPP maturation protein n=1 Tax=Pseudomonas plecoglossicida TaxID=70775 RepID=UPI003D19BCEE
MADTLQAQQLRMSRHIRDPQANPPPPGIEARRLAVYRQLFFGNLQSMLAGSFPVLHACLAPGEWRELIQDFYASHACQTPLFTQVPGELVEYLHTRSDLPGWVAELAHYEWIETVLLLSDDDEPAPEPDTGLLEAVPVLSRVAMPLAYAWPVDQIGPGHIPQQAPQAPTLLLAYRGSDLQVHFSSLAPLAHALLVSLQQRRCSGREHLALLAQRAGVQRALIELQGLALLDAFSNQGVVIAS